MKHRLFLLILLLVFRCILGWLSVSDFESGRKIIVSGHVINTTQKVSECITQISVFLFSTNNICALNRGVKVTVIGRIDNRVIDVLNGNLWLRDAKIDDSTFGSDQKTVTDSKKDIINNFRNVLSDRLKYFMPSTEAGLVSGIVFGNKKDISQKFYDEMIDSGTVHIAVASGYNIMLVGSTLSSLMFWLVGRRYATLIVIFVMAVYAILAGADPPVVRAWWMASLLYLSLLLGRSGSSWWTLLVASWVMLMIDPSLFLNVSFQLSVAASVGLICVEPWIVKKIKLFIGENGGKVVSGLGLTTTVSTMLVTMPFLWWHFGRLSLIGILSNTLILPFVPLLMTLGVGVILLPWVFWVPAYVVAHWVVEVIRFLGN